jgi:signal transduction histidine kinase
MSRSRRGGAARQDRAAPVRPAAARPQAIDAPGVPGAAHAPDASDPPGAHDPCAGPATTLAGGLDELRRTRLLLSLASLPDLALEAGEGTASPLPLQHVATVIQRDLGVSTVGFALRRARDAGGAGDADGASDVSLEAAGNSGLSEHVVTEAEPLLMRVLATGEPLHLDALSAAGADKGLLDRLAASVLLALPIAGDVAPRGGLDEADRRPVPFTDEERAFLGLVAGQVGLLLERAALIRAQRELERQRAQAAARQEFLGLVTHELKTPVAVLRAYLELLLGRAEQAGRTDEVEVLRRMEDQAERLLGMVEQVLDLQRLDSGLFPLEIGRVDLVALAMRVVEGLQLTARDVRLRVEADPSVAQAAGAPAAGAEDTPVPAEEEATPRLRVRADRRRIEQVLLNLLQNAIRFSPPGETVLVRLAYAERHPHHPGETEARRGSGHAASPPAVPANPARGWAVVAVSDRGPGVAAEDRPRIFARFYQGKGGDRLHLGHGGLGVGLSIAQEIVARHGGELWLEPSQPADPAGTASPGTEAAQWRVGATFTFTLPVAGPEEGD